MIYLKKCLFALAYKSRGLGVCYFVLKKNQTLTPACGIQEFTILRPVCIPPPERFPPQNNRIVGSILGVPVWVGPCGMIFDKLPSGSRFIQQNLVSQALPKRWGEGSKGGLPGLPLVSFALSHKGIRAERLPLQIIPPPPDPTAEPNL